MSIPIPMEYLQLNLLIINEGCRTISTSSVPLSTELNSRLPTERRYYPMPSGNKPEPAGKSSPLKRIFDVQQWGILLVLLALIVPCSVDRHRLH